MKSRGGAGRFFAIVLAAGTLIISFLALAGPLIEPAFSMGSLVGFFYMMAMGGIIVGVVLITLCIIEKVYTSST